MKNKEEQFYYASQWQLIWWRFKRHRMAVIGGVVLLIMYILGIFCEFFAPYDPNRYNARFPYAPPQVIHFFHEGKFIGPFVYGYKSSIDLETLRRVYTVDKSQIYKIKFFVRGDKYKLWGIWESDLHFIGVEKGGYLFLLGTDALGRDMLSRILYGARISTTIGLVGVFLSFALGIVIGGISGYLGGVVDNFIQRTIEVIRSIPTIPLWMALSAAVPPNWSPVKVYFAVTVILSLTSWTGLARVVRSRFLSLREEDFVMAAKFMGASNFRIIFRHMLPSFISYLIASITLSIPNMILGETSLSFLGLGIRPPAISWGVLLQGAQNLTVVSMYPWLLLPVVFVIVTVLCFNFVGDGLRDAADPYANM
ncbi:MULTISPECIES: ABC transporter permease [unclassified Thermotoga]|uniref:ABC transporter permease n=1 Tax=unclassified Thermotoga TaxID=2631113 RepID=UPI000686DC26|nr:MULTISPECIES: ABC transporter permease [unclassified Thermotoga]